MRLDLLLVPALLVACNTPLADELARDAARRTIDPVIAARFPGVPLRPATDCIIDNASAAEILQLASAAGAGANDVATRIVLDVAARPQTLQCLATDGLPVLLNTL